MDKQQEQIEEMKRHIKNSLTGVLEIEIDKLAKELLKHYQPKIPENAVVLTKEEYEHINSCYDIVHKETAEKYSDKLVAIIQHLFDIGQINFKAKIELLKENEIILKQFSVELEEGYQ